MEYAIDLFDGGTVVYPDDKISYRKLACPECLEPVTPVIKHNSEYFAHYPMRTDSPPCSLRVDSVGISFYEETSDRVANIFRLNFFQKAISTKYRIASLQLHNPNYELAITKLIAAMQQFYLKNERCIDLSKLPNTCPGLLHKYTDTWSAIKAYIKDRKYESLLAPSMIYDYSEPRHVASVYYIWKQLHLTRLEDNLRFLLRFALIWSFLYASQKDRYTTDLDNELGANSSYTTFSGFVISNAFSILISIPWLEIKSFLKSSTQTECIGCKRLFDCIPGLEVRKCNKCGATYCLACLHTCRKCHQTFCNNCFQKHA